MCQQLLHLLLQDTSFRLIYLLFVAAVLSALTHKPLPICEKNSSFCIILAGELKLFQHLFYPGYTPSGLATKFTFANLKQGYVNFSVGTILFF